MGCPNSAGKVNLCILGAIGRFVEPGQILSSGQGGAVSLQIDLNMIPQPSSFVSVLPGETWYFQFWHRDVVAGAPASNYAASVRINFQ